MAESVLEIMSKGYM